MTSWGDALYIGGGYSEIGPLNDFWEYHKDGEWKCINISSQENPFPRMMCSGCQFNDEIYLFGGIQQFDEDVLIQNDLWKYDIRHKRWILLQSESPISERYNHVVVSISPTQMLVHGGECNGLFGDCWVYDIGTRSFTQVPTPIGGSPCPRSSHSCTFLHPYVVIFGGVSNSHICGGDTPEDSSPVYLNDLWLMDTSLSDNPEQWTWRMLPFEGLAPSPRDMASLLNISEFIQKPHSILLYGGYGLSEIDSESEFDQEDVQEERCMISMPSGIENEIALEASAHIEGESETVTLPLDSLSLTEETIGHQENLKTDPTEGNVLSEEKNDDDNDDDNSICEAYLDDAWVIDLVNGRTEEVTLDAPNTQYFNLGGWRGTRFAILHSIGPQQCLELTSFGGFNGEKFADHVPSISIT